MATEQQLRDALLQAHTAGDFEAAQLFADKIKAGEFDQQEPVAQPPAYTDPRLGMLDAAGAVITGAIAEPVAGLAGIAQSLNPFSEQTGGEAVEATREALTYEPRTPEGRENLIALGKTLKPVLDILERAEKASGDLGYDIAGPIGGAIGKTLPTALGEMLGIAGAKGAAKPIQKVGDVVRAEPDEAAKQVLRAGEQFDVPVLNTDVNPPETFAGRLAQGLSEKLGPLGSGTARASQQRAREAAVQGFADSMDIDLDTPFARDIVNSINRKTAEDMAAAGKIRAEAVESLDTYGAVPLDQTKQAISREIARQERLGAKGNVQLIQNLQDTLEAAEGGDFSLVKDIRTEVISDLKAINRGEDTRAAASVQAVKSAIDEDMLNFARKNDRDAAAKWVKSNREFAEGYSRVRDTELKRILKSGEATPERIIPLIRGGKPSELQRLKKSIDAEGQVAVRSAIIQDALKEARFFNVDESPNPDAFATAMQKPNRQQAVRVFFEGQEREALDGLTRLLNATRRAQQGSAVIKTGEQVVPMLAAGGIGGAVYADALTGLSVTALGSAVAKAYESKAFRNLLLKIKNSKPSSRGETRLLESAMTAVVAELQAAKAAQEESQEEQQIPYQ